MVTSRTQEKANKIAEGLRVDLYGSSVLLEEFGKVIAPGGSGVVVSSQSGHRLPWNFSKPVVTSPLIGASKTAYVDDAIAALGLKLIADEIAYLEEPYVPHNQYGFR